MSKYAEELRWIYRKISALNLYVSSCNVRKTRVLNELITIKNNIERLIGNLE